MSGLPPVRSISESPHSSGHSNSSSRTEYSSSGYHILVYRNGDVHDHGTAIHVTRLQFRHWLYFLDFLTTRIKSQVAVNRLYTVDGKKEIRHFRHLESGERYVAAGGVFTPVQYGTIQHPTWKKSRVVKHEDVTGIHSGETNMLYLQKRGFQPVLRDMWDLSSFDLKGKSLGHSFHEKPSDYLNVTHHYKNEAYTPPANLKSMNLNGSLSNNTQTRNTFSVRPRSGTGPNIQSNTGHHKSEHPANWKHKNEVPNHKAQHVENHQKSNHSNEGHHHKMDSEHHGVHSRKNSYVPSVTKSAQHHGHSSAGKPPETLAHKAQNHLAQFKPVKCFYNLLYFDGVRSRAEQIRLILRMANVPYEEKLVSLSQWPSLKPLMPMGQLPVLVFADGRYLCQSYAIGRYLAREHGLMGSSNLEAAMINMLVSRVAEMSKYFGKILEAKDEKAKREEFLYFQREKLDVFLDRFDTVLDNHGNKWFVGDKISWVDLVVAEFVGNLRDYWDQNILTEFPSLNQHVQRVRSHPQLKKYIETRPHPAMGV